MPSFGSSIVVGDRRGDEGIAERAFELRADLLDTDPHAGLDADRMAQPKVRAGRVRAYNLLVRQDGPLDRGAARKAGLGRGQLDLDDSSPLFVQEAGVG